MTSERLLQNFDHLIDTPDAVPRLRRFILDLAVRGKLVEQNPEDEPAGELLKRLSLDSELSQLEEEVELPSDIPERWIWAQLTTIAHVEMGQSPLSESYNQSGDGIPFYQGKADFG